MRVPIPKRIEAKYAVLYIAFIFTGQLIEGTDLLFAVLVAVYNGLWILAFNVAGGLEYPSGAFIFANGISSVVIGFGAKVLLGQPGERNMLAPYTTLSCYCAGMLMMLIVAFLTRTMRPAQPLLRNYETLAQMKQAAIVCLVASLITTGALLVGGGGFAGTISQLSSGYPLMAILLATTYEVKHSNGRRSINWITGTVLAYYIFFGLVNFGKTLLLLGFVAWIVAAILQGYDFKKKQILGMAFGVFFFSYYLTPYSQYARLNRAGSVRENLPAAIDNLLHLQRTRELYEASIEEVDLSYEAHLYDKRVGFLDRLVIVAADDKLINFTAEGNVFGISPTIAAYANVVPRVLWPSKPILNTGNAYAHEFGDELAEEDLSTGISFSATADAFHQASWLGILAILPLNLFICFIVNDSLVGSARNSQIALLPIMTMFLSGGEGGLGILIYDATYFVIGLWIIMWMTKTAAPFLLQTFRRNRVDSGRSGAVAVVRPAPGASN